MVKGNAVYISFDGREDTIRHSFLSHLAAVFHHISISFFACEDPASDDRFSQETDAAISNARVSLVIFSEKFATSKPCLKDLSKVFKCRRSKGLVVVPVFYGITKSELKKQCMKLKNMSPNDLGEDWRHALLEIAELPGHVSSDNRSDSELVEEIVADVRQKLDLKSKIGIYSRLMKMEKLLCKQPWGVRSLGIWGMGGIGKTTLADAAFNQMSSDFEASCFIENFDEAFKEMGVYGLLKEHFGKILMKELDKSSRVTILSLLKDKLRNKRLLLVLDNVHKPLGAAKFLGWFDSLGYGSLVVITSRDKQVLVQCRVNEIYEVQGLSGHEALQLFSRCAFGKDVPDQNLLELSMKLVDYANGNPLVLSIFGSELGGKTLSEMESVVDKHKERLPDKIFDVFKSSYDALSDSEKNIFLDIACFFRGENVDNVMQLLAGCGFFARIGIDVLVDKSLVTVSENRVQMHSLIHKVGLKIIRNQEEEIEMGYRLLDASNSQSLLDEMDLGNEEDIEAIILDTSNLDFEVHIGLEDMYNLRYLKIYSSHPTKYPGLRLPSGLQSLSSELRLLHWENCPLQSFPQDFDIQHVVELNMPNSKLQKLWEGTKNLEKLKRIRLCNSQQLVNVDGIQYSRNIELIDLQGCSSLQSFPDTSQLQHLEVVNLSACVEIKSFPKVPLSIRELYLQGTGKLDFLKINDCSHLKTLPDMVTFESLEVLDLSGCSELEEIQGLPQNLKELYLARTAVREISSSLYRSKLVILDMQDCKRLRDLPMGMSNMKSLAMLKLSGCSKLENIWDLPRNLKELYLTGTAVKEFPSLLLQDRSKLIVLDLENCQKLQHLPMGMSNLKSLVMLKLSGCSDLENICDFPQNLKELYLDGTAIRELPPSVGDLPELDTLDLKNCKRLRHLPMGMQNLNPLKVLDLSNCSELEVSPSSLPEARELRLAHTAMPLRAKLPQLRLAHTVLSLGAKLPSSFSRFYAHIVTLSLYKARLENIPEEICWMSSLKKLDLSGNCFQNIPVSIKEFSKLLSLKLHYCNNLRSLPELPPSLQHLNAHGCLSLRSIPLDFEQLPRYYTFSNCFGLSRHMVNEFLAKALAYVEYMEPQPRQVHKNALAFSFCLPSCRNSTFNLQPGSSVMIRLDPYTRSMIAGFAILVEVSFLKDFHDGAGLSFWCVCRWNDKKGHAQRVENSFHCWAPGEAAPKIKKDHTFVFCDLKMHLSVSEGSSSEILDNLVILQVFPVNTQDKLVGDICKVTKCGVCVIPSAVGSSSKETDEESSMDIELDISPPKKSANLKMKGFQAPSPKTDLESSLSGGRFCQSELAAVQQRGNLSQTLVDMLRVTNEESKSCGSRPEFSSPTLHASSSKERSSFLSHAPKNVTVPAARVLDLSSSMTTTTSPTSSATTSPTSSAITAPISSATSGLTQQSSSSSQLCQVKGCQKRARGPSCYCISHGGVRRCQKHGCHKGAEGKTAYCKTHGGGRRCEFLGCTKSAEGRTDFCIAHGGGRRCSQKDCTRAARGKSGLCIRHGGGKRCQREYCTKSAEGHSGLCIYHGGGRRCQFKECTKGAQGSTMFCKAHGGRKRCTHIGCTKDAEGSTLFCKVHGGGKRCAFQGGGVCPKSVHGGNNFCVAHGGGERCAVPECTKSARGWTDFCLIHGGGKRCKFERCGKNAQGSTDFCEAHGGQNRSAWGHPETEYAGHSSSGGLSAVHYQELPLSSQIDLNIDPMPSDSEPLI